MRVYFMRVYFMRVYFMGVCFSHVFLMCLDNAKLRGNAVYAACNND